MGVQMPSCLLSGRVKVGRVTLIVALPLILTSSGIISSQISSIFLKFPLRFSISSHPGWQDGTIKVTLKVGFSFACFGVEEEGRDLWGLPGVIYT